jgi:hypothetical protein
MRSDKISLIKKNSKNSMPVMKTATKVKVSGKIYSRKKYKSSDLY